MHHEQEYFNAESADSREIYRSEQVKNQYSTFIEELQETTEKLMNEVFNTQYKPQIEDEQDLVLDHQRRMRGLSDMGGYHSADPDVDLKFRNFMRRNQKWREMKEMNLNKQLKKKQQEEKRKMREVPEILRGSLEKMEPIYERGLDLHASKEKKIAFKKIDQKRKQQEEYRKYKFHPEINNKNKVRTLQQYLRDKEEWEKKKNESREFKKLQQQAKKYNECHFAPHLVSKQMGKAKKGEKVEERLLRSLEKFISQQ